MSNAARSIPLDVAAVAPDGILTTRQRRSLRLAIIRRRQRPGTGSSREVLERRTAMIEWPDLREILRTVPWAIVGDVATRAYMPERMTQDLDILVATADGPEARRRLEEANFETLSPLSIPGIVMRSPKGVEIDLLFGEAPWVSEALAGPARDAAGYPVIGLPYLVLMKLQATRDQDWTDITRMLGGATEDHLEGVRAVVRQFSPADIEDLETMIYLGQREQS
jgi:hypothetical protein